MADVTIFRNSSDKPFEIFLDDLKKAIEAEGFSIHHPDKSDLVTFYRDLGVPMPDNYRHAMIQICQPEKSGKSLPVNPERSVFLHKYIFVYNKGGKTEIRFLGYSAQLIGDLLGHNEYEKGPSDDFFAERLADIFETMDKIVKTAV
ncbi:MAG: hypothetical protein JXQ81_05260 [Desulfuromonadales bacterium]|nr:hypothetical protein [Desulfuromonadales bacterium]